MCDLISSTNLCLFVILYHAFILSSFVIHFNMLTRNPFVTYLHIFLVIFLFIFPYEIKLIFAQLKYQLLLLGSH